MQSVIKQIQEYKTLDMILDLDYPIIENEERQKELTITVERFSLKEEEQARYKADGQLKIRNITKENTTPQEFLEESNMAFYKELGEYVLEHIKGWQHIDPEQAKAFPFNSINLKSFKATRTSFDKADLGLSYYLASRVRKEDKKKTYGRGFLEAVKRRIEHNLSNYPNPQTLNCGTCTKLVADGKREHPDCYYKSCAASPVMHEAITCFISAYNLLKTELYKGQSFLILKANKATEEDIDVFGMIDMIYNDTKAKKESNR